MPEELRRPAPEASPRAMAGVLMRRLQSWTASGLLQPLMEPILHPSHWRIRALGFTTLVGHPLFFLLWGLWLPQPYENLTLRLVMSGLGLSLLVIPGITATPPSPSSPAPCCPLPSRSL